jgi:hypothetical protein
MAPTVCRQPFFKTLHFLAGLFAPEILKFTVHRNFHDPENHPHGKAIITTSKEEGGAGCRRIELQNRTF